MPPHTPTANPGCFAQLVRWGLSSVILVVACGVVATLVPKSVQLPPNQYFIIETAVPTALLATVPAFENRERMTPESEVPDRVEQMATQPPTEIPTQIPSTLIRPTNTPLPEPVANESANLRGGPGTNFEVIGGVSPGQRLFVVATSPDRQWLLLDGGAWISAGLVGNIAGNLPVASNIPQSPAVPTDTPVPIVVEPTAPPLPTATPVPSIPAVPVQEAQNCDPSYPDFCLQRGLPDLDCKDVPYARFKVFQPDPHGFDGNDNDGLGCESN